VAITEDRDRLTALLDKAGIPTLVHYPIPPHLQKAYSEIGLGRGSLPIAERLAAQVISLPISPHMSDDQVNSVIAAVSEAGRFARTEIGMHA
jgi:dTDP-4-amino-4,6-dideoxygalactose transaminase